MSQEKPSLGQMHTRSESEATAALLRMKQTKLRESERKALKNAIRTRSPKDN